MLSEQDKEQKRLLKIEEWENDPIIDKINKSSFPTDFIVYTIPDKSSSPNAEPEEAARSGIDKKNKEKITTLYYYHTSTREQDIYIGTVVNWIDKSTKRVYALDTDRKSLPDPNNPTKEIRKTVMHVSCDEGKVCEFHFKDEILERSIISHKDKERYNKLLSYLSLSHRFSDPSWIVLGSLGDRLRSWQIGFGEDHIYNEEEIQDISTKLDNVALKQKAKEEQYEIKI